MKYIVFNLIAITMLVSPIFAASPDDIKPPTIATTPLARINISVQASPCFNSMEDAQKFTTITSNLCSATNTNPVCFMQIAADPAAGGTTKGVISCPTGFNNLFSFGTDIQSTGSTKKLVHTPRDVVAPLDQAKRDFYASQYYTISQIGPERCEYKDAYSSNWSYYCAGALVAGAQWPIPNLMNTFQTINGTPDVLVSSNSPNKDGPWCMTGYTTYTAGSCGYPDKCGTLPAAGINTRWKQSFFYCGTQMQAVREAGFYPPYPGPGKPPYNLPTPDNTYSPTTVICGKTLTLWKTVNPATPDVAPKKCNILDPLNHPEKLALDANMDDR